VVLPVIGYVADLYSIYVAIGVVAILIFVNVLIFRMPDLKAR